MDIIDAKSEDENNNDIEPSERDVKVSRGYVSGEVRLPSSSSEYKLLRMFKFIEAVSETAFDMINATYYGKPLVFIRAISREKLVSHHQAVNINF